MSFAPKGLIFYLSMVFSNQIYFRKILCNLSTSFYGGKENMKSKRNIAMKAVKNSITKFAEKKANTNCLGLMYEPQKPEKKKLYKEKYLIKKFKHLLSIILIGIMILNTGNTGITAFANTIQESDYNFEDNNNIAITDNGIYVNSIYYSREQFVQLLDTAQEIEGIQAYSEIALVAGTWFIPGVGEVVITVAGVIIVGGVVVKAGSWIYNAVTNWFEKRAFNKSAEDAINNCDNNKRNHIMQSKHNWNKFSKDPKWSDVSPILIKVLQEGNEKWEKNNQYIRTLVYKGETVVVRFIKDEDGLVKYISTAWCK